MTAFEDARVGIIYGTDTGNTEDIGERIALLLAAKGKEAEMVNVTDVASDDFAGKDLLILGIPTWDFGGIQADWEDYESAISDLKLSGKAIALYGLGDQFGYADFFVDAMGWLFEQLQSSGARFIGFWSTEGYEFEASRALLEGQGKFCGLAIDEDQQFELTNERLTQWVNQLVAEYQQLSQAA